MGQDLDIGAFISRWMASGAAERANYGLFLTELCDLLEVPRPDPTRPDPAENTYVFERDVEFRHGDGSTTNGRIDLYKRGAFVLEAKQGSDHVEATPELELTSAPKRKRKGTAVRGTKAWDDAMVRARGQADLYARALPAADGWPPFLIVVDVGHSIELYSEFSRSGRSYVPFPDPQSHRLTMDDLQRPEIRERLRGVMVIDLFGLDAEEVRVRFPAVFQRVVERVKPERDQNNRATYRDKWWIYGEPRGAFRPALKDLKRYIATVETAKHRVFQFLDAEILPDNMLVNIAIDDAFALGVLSSRIHMLWALTAGGRLGVGNDPRYNKTRCFDRFPFPECSEEAKQRIRELAEQLDGHRKQQQAANPKLTLTDMYNVLEKLRSGEPLSDKDKSTNQWGLVSVLKEIHDELDAAVFEAYGWPTELSDDEILEWLAALNAERVQEEARGVIRWLRPEFQSPAGGDGAGLRQIEFDTGDEGEITPVGPLPAKKAAWPKSPTGQVKAVREVLQNYGKPASAADVAVVFSRASLERIEDVLNAMALLGNARRIGENRYAL